jgi:hypothetical protein
MIPNSPIDRDAIFKLVCDAGLLDEMQRSVEERNQATRLEVVAELSALPPVEKTEIPALGKQCAAARIDLDEADRAYRSADKKLKELSMQLYGAELHFNGSRMALTTRAQELAPKFVTETIKALGWLKSEVSIALNFFVEHKRSVWGNTWTETTSNQDEITACTKAINEARKAVMDLLVSTDSLEQMRIKCEEILSAVSERAFRLGVNRRAYEARDQPKVEPTPGLDSIPSKKARS